MKINKLLIATHNSGKFKEISRYLLPLKVQLFSLADLGIKEDYQEIGATYQENALGKAKFYYQLSGLPSLADDSGLSVEALNGEPGINSRTWPGYRAGDEELLKMLLAKMEKVQADKRHASFITTVAYCDGQNEVISQGEVRGLIAQKQLCPIEAGFPYSSVFIPKGHNLTFSQLTVEQKNQISHRGLALNEFIRQIEKI
ncbi:MAG: RdgB/HAM1 family non-canonical purine NTP pyrophosphatase [Patescibacteria group bacterium]|nr:RdgB/HAM1 family non-canonical purine NTP pyrophosphatase [Patescibacteria group bacterium]